MTKKTISDKFGNITNSKALSDTTSILKISLILIITVVFFEIIAGFISNSLALITDGTHAVLDAIVTGLLLLSTILASRPRDRDHTYGHGRIETIGSLVGGLILFGIAIFFVYESLIKIAYGKSDSLILEHSNLIIISVVYTMIIDCIRIFLLKKSNKRHQSSTIKTDLLHAIGDLISTFVIIIGLTIVSIGYNFGDSIAAIVLGGFLLFLSGSFIYRNAMDLSDAISPNLVERTREIIQHTKGVLECKDIKMRKVGNELFIESLITIRADTSFEDAHDISAEVEKNLIEKLMVKKVNTTIHFEPTTNTDLPLEYTVKKAALDINGVLDVHNIIVAKIKESDKMHVSLHIQINRNANLSDAHKIANQVEDSIKYNVKDLDDVIVHLEPRFSDTSNLEKITDAKINDEIVSIILNHGYVKEIRKISLFKTNNNNLKIDVYCIFGNENETIELNHQRVSEIEKEIQKKFPNSILTIHSEPR